MRKFKIFLVLLASELFVFSVKAAEAEAPESEVIASGVTLRRLSYSEPQRMRGALLTIDLSNPKIEIVVTPGNGERPGETDGVRTSTFVREQKLAAAINASPFDVVHGKERLPQNVAGLLLSNGELISAPANHPAILFAPGKAWIKFIPVDISGAVNGVGGFGVILKDGHVRARLPQLDPRTAVGIDKTGKKLFLLVIDGRQDASDGATNADMAWILRSFGASDALSLDGGGTSTLVVGDGQGSATVVNTPVDGNVLGRERVSGCHLGVRVMP